MPTISRPVQPQVEHFFPQTTVARVLGDRFIDDGTHLDTQARLYRHAPETFITEWTAGYAATSFSIHGLSLVRGVVYRVRIRYQNENDWSPWSKPVYGKVGQALPFSSLAVPSEPLNGGALPVTPSYVVPLDHHRSMGVDRKTATHHLLRRPKYDDERVGTQFTWECSTADKDTLIAFLQARVKAAPPEAFSTNSVEYGERFWVTIDGLIEQVQVDNLNWIVRCQAYEVPGESVVWTVDSSTVGGEDELA